MAKYTVQMSYNATITLVVDADEEGEALDKARDIAEDADIRQFTICNENEAKIVDIV